MFGFYPSEGLGLAVLFNRPAVAAYRWSGSVLDRILESRYGRKQPAVDIEAFSAVTLPEAELRKYVGNWLGNEAATELKIEDSRLIAVRGGDDVPARTVSGSEFAIPNEGPSGEAVRHATSRCDRCGELTITYDLL